MVKKHDEDHDDKVNETEEVEEGEITSKDEVVRTLVEKVGKIQKIIPPRLARAAQRSDSYAIASATRDSKPSGNGKKRKAKKP